MEAFAPFLEATHQAKVKEDDGFVLVTTMRRLLVGALYFNVSRLSSRLIFNVLRFSSILAPGNLTGSLSPVSITPISLPSSCFIAFQQLQCEAVLTVLYLRQTKSCYY